MNERLKALNDAKTAIQNMIDGETRRIARHNTEAPTSPNGAAPGWLNQLLAAHAAANAAKTSCAQSCEAQRETRRREGYSHALHHWLRVGFKYETARAMAAVKWSADADVRAWGLAIVLAQTNLREKDMI